MAHTMDWCEKEELGDKISDYLATAVMELASGFLEICLEHQYPEGILSGRELVNFLSDYIKLTAHMTRVLPSVTIKAAMGASQALLGMAYDGEIKTYTGEELMEFLDKEMNEVR